MIKYLRHLRDGILCMLAQCLCGVLFRSLFRAHVFGWEHLPMRGGVILTCNHASGLDPLLAGWITGRPTRFLARTTLLKGFGGFVMRLLGSHPIERGSADWTAIRAGLNFLSRGEPLVLFPEGTRSLDGRLQPILGGVGLLAAKSATPIVPMYISGAHLLLPKGKLLPRPGRILVLIGTPIYPETLRCSDSAREWYDRITEAVRESLYGLQDEADRVWNSERAMIGHAEDNSR